MMIFTPLCLNKGMGKIIRTNSFYIYKIPKNLIHLLNTFGIILTYTKGKLILFGEIVHMLTSSISINETNMFYGMYYTVCMLIVCPN